MSFAADQIAELKLLCAGVQQCEEAGCTYLLLPGLKLPKGCSPSKTDALLCPTPRDGYPFRLYFAVRVESSAQLNWNAQRVRIIERNWDAFSWKVGEESRLIQMIAAYLGHLK